MDHQPLHSLSHMWNHDNDSTGILAALATLDEDSRLPSCNIPETEEVHFKPTEAAQLVSSFGPQEAAAVAVKSEEENQKINMAAPSHAPLSSAEKYAQQVTEDDELRAPYFYGKVAVKSEVEEENQKVDMTSPTHSTLSSAEKYAQLVNDDDEPRAPYFYYKDYSTLPDQDPNTPVTAPGRIPNFPAKMFAILSRPDLADIVSWMPHGRSWKVHKPREFEVKVIPTYFEHSKFSSFIRQANGWGFRRMISKGADRNSYYHELFLRGKPYLVKLMKRPSKNAKPLAEASTEPDFYQISEGRPLPELQAGNAGGCGYDKEVHGVLAHCTFVEKRQTYSGQLITGDHMTMPACTTCDESLAKLGFSPMAFEPYKIFHHEPHPCHHHHHATPATGVFAPTGAPSKQHEMTSFTPDIHYNHVPDHFVDNLLLHQEAAQGFEDPFAEGLKPCEFF
jgi:hypothetical protein